MFKGVVKINYIEIKIEGVCVLLGVFSKFWRKGRNSGFDFKLRH